MRNSPRRRAFFIRPSYLVGIVVCLFAGFANAQGIPLGKWTGQLQLPQQGHILDISFQVTQAEDGALDLVLNTGESRFETTETTFLDGNLSFRWVPGETTVHCQLAPDTETGLFTGTCGEGGEIEFQMTPPSGE